MPDAVRVAVALLDRSGHPGVASALADATGATVVATVPADHVEVVRDLAADHDLVVGVARTPWPQHASLHEAAGRDVAVYRGVVAWHALPRLLDDLAQAAAPGAAGGAHLLITAPDPGPDAPPEEVTFLREVAEGVTARVAGNAPSSRSRSALGSIAWRGTTRTPTAVDALTAVLTVHGHRDVVEVPVAPGTGSDPELLAVAEQHGARLTTVDVSTAVLVTSLATVVDTVVDHERADDHEQSGDPGGAA